MEGVFCHTLEMTEMELTDFGDEDQNTEPLPFNPLLWGVFAEEDVVASGEMS